MKKKKYKVVAWKEETLHERLQRCRIMLLLHGMIGDRDNARIGERIEKDWLKFEDKK